MRRAVEGRGPRPVVREERHPADLRHEAGARPPQPGPDLAGAPHAVLVDPEQRSGNSQCRPPPHLVKRTSIGSPSRRHATDPMQPAPHYPRRVSDQTDLGSADGTDHDRHFGEEGARLTYGSYLRVAELLDQQHLESDPPAHDELLFITVHQVYELWFKQLLHELTAAREEMFSGDLWRARHLLARVVAIEDVLIRQVAVLETMTPQDFLVFRDRLAPASGFQSVQFRELEFLSGAKDPGYLDRFRGLTAEERARLRAPARRAVAVGGVPPRRTSRRPAGRHRRGGHRRRC